MQMERGAWWDHYSEFFSDEELWRKGGRQRLLDYFAKFARQHGGRDVLDVGCGPGLGMERLRDMGFHPTGADLSPRMVELARARHFNVALTDGAPLPFEDQRFDYIFCCTLLEWTENPLELLGEMVRVTKPGGGLVIACLGPRGLPHEDALKRLRGEPTYYNMLMPVELHELLIRHDLKIRSMTGVRAEGVPEEIYAKLDWVGKSFSSLLWIIGADKHKSSIE